MLPGSIKAAWNDPDNLYGVIVSALEDGFRSDVVNASRRLYEIDPDRTRATCIWGIVLKDEVGSMRPSRCCAITSRRAAMKGTC